MRRLKMKPTPLCNKCVHFTGGPICEKTGNVTGSNNTILSALTCCFVPKPKEIKDGKEKE